MDQLSAHLKAIRVPSQRDNVYKEECVYSFDTPVSFYHEIFFFFAVQHTSIK